MTGVIELKFLDRLAVAQLLSLRQLLHSCWLLIRVLVPLTVLCLIGLGALQLLYQRNPFRADGVRQLGVEHFIVLEQARRAAELQAPDVVFLGDSSCLMGVDPRIVEAALDGRKVQSFCSIGYVGPAGYAQMIDGMIARNAAPKTLILMFHPVTFRPHPSWVGWTEFLSDPHKFVKLSRPFPRGALDYVEFEWLRRFIYSPMPGPYGLYYGGETAFRSTIASRQGSAIDPYNGLNVLRIEDVKVVPTPPIGEATNFSASQAYLDALEVLGKTIRKLPQASVYLVISPLPDYAFRPGTSEQRTERAVQIADALGIDHSHILTTPATSYAAYFASPSHLNRWGQQFFSGELAKQLAATIR